MIRKTILILVIFFVLLSGCIVEKSPEKGTLQFTSSPSGAQVYLDDQFRGSAPCTVTGIEPGNHTLEFRYPGYESWSTVMAVSSGSNNVFAALQPTPASTTPIPVILVTTSPTGGAQPFVTIKASRDSIVTGDSVMFSGTAIGCNQVQLTMSGPGAYVKGVPFASVPNVNSAGEWSYYWNPGSGLMPGTYTMTVSDPYKTTSDSASVKVTGNGQLSITANNFAAVQGNTVWFSGLCTTGSQNVQLVLYGPGQYTGGVALGTVSVLADKNWNFPFTIDLSTPTGYYTMYVYDVPKTATSSVQFSVGYA
ncbi:PEGA domain-containing protein [uncultured Methanoregula sp.]|uniref:PEGA domain-containing protein n=1 Tax=uncultured Methanoregula sp. TaxID=1005933 RepID=UPI002AABA057|nr:PEGA domain-containing protein [uncultured Methanoregula sp.]